MTTMQLDIPEHLGTAGREFFTSVLGEYRIEDAHHLALLGRAAEQLDRAAAARALIDRDGVSVLDRFGSIKEHPSIATERLASVTFTRLVAALGLDLPASGRK